MGIHQLGKIVSILDRRLLVVRLLLHAMRHSFSDQVRKREQGCSYRAGSTPKSDSLFSVLVATAFTIHGFVSDEHDGCKSAGIVSRSLLVMARFRVLARSLVDTGCASGLNE